MAANFSGDWSVEIAAVSCLPEFQNCRIEIRDDAAVRYPGPNYPGDPDDLVTDGYDYRTNSYKTPVIDGKVYVGPARFIPIRAGIHFAGEGQSNATTVRNMRFQIPQYDGPQNIRKSLKVLITEAPKNPNLVGWWATVVDDFQGSSAAARTFTAAMDADGAPDA